MPKPFPRILPPIVLLALVLADQLLKALAIFFLPDITTSSKNAVVLIPNDLELGLAWDPAFGFGVGNALPDWLQFALFGVVPFLLVGLLLWWYLRSTWTLTRGQLLSLTILLAGVVGNTIDRWLHGTLVANFLSLRFMAAWLDGDWYVTNLADLCVVVGGLSSLWTFRRPIPVEKD